MKICAFSDPHGQLPVIEKCDVVLICGDIVPAINRIQRNDTYSEVWFKDTFAEWVRNTPCQHVVFIAGNHDFWLEHMGEKMNDFIDSVGLKDKLHYLQDSSITIDGLTIYGCPWCVGPMGWAFVSPDAVNMKKNFNSDAFPNKYESLKDCDILLTHQPPMHKDVGVSNDYFDKPNFGSPALLETATKHNISYWFCGHIHSGDHTKNSIKVKNDQTCTLYNVSYINEEYRVAYQPLYLDI